MKKQPFSRPAQEEKVWEKDKPAIKGPGPPGRKPGKPCSVLNIQSWCLGALIPPDMLSELILSDRTLDLGSRSGMAS